jgi:hypothetical protein
LTERGVLEALLIRNNWSRKGPNFCTLAETHVLAVILVCKNLVQKLMLLHKILATVESGFEPRLRAGVHPRSKLGLATASPQKRQVAKRSKVLHRVRTVLLALVAHGYHSHPGILNTHAGTALGRAVRLDRQSRAIIIGQIIGGEKLECELPALVDTRLLIQANSGGGKSWLLRLIAERAGIQTIVLDNEGEFASLREAVDMLLVGASGELPANPRHAALLARRLLEYQNLGDGRSL